ncbi:hypothetical protein JB92DRAFT_771407 [Gautieria morchelliformis]|nr:hypothetical protein JB92DRAFT_771407 [Gautieria morchelliformis]
MVTESFLANPELVDKWTLNQGRQSVRTTNCTSSTCQEAKPIRHEACLPASYAHLPSHASRHASPPRLAEPQNRSTGGRRVHRGPRTRPAAGPGNRESWIILRHTSPLPCPF